MNSTGSSRGVAQKQSGSMAWNLHSRISNCVGRRCASCLLSIDANHEEQCNRRRRRFRVSARAQTNASGGNATRYQGRRPSRLFRLFIQFIQRHFSLLLFLFIYLFYFIFFILGCVSISVGVVPWAGYQVADKAPQRPQAATDKSGSLQKVDRV